jgi:Bacterial PH domain
VNLPLDSWDSVFIPPRRRGLALQISVTLILFGGATFSFVQAQQSQAGPDFLARLLLSLVLFAPTPFLGYRSYALSRAGYRLERDGLRMRWGFRSEDIPLPEIEWIRPANELAIKLPLPWLHWPGSILGTRQVEGLGPIEFMASDLNTLLLVATPQRIFAISPAEPKAFLSAFQSLNELGSLAPLPALSVYPTFVIGRLWDDRLARGLLLTSLALEGGLLAWVGLTIPSHPVISLGFLPTGGVEVPGPGARLLLLPVINGIDLFIDLVLGLYFYRRPTRKPMAYLLWSTAIFSALLFYLAVWFIVTG